MLHVYPYITIFSRVNDFPVTVCMAPIRINGVSPLDQEKMTPLADTYMAAHKQVKV